MLLAASGWGRAALLAPVIVIGIGLIAAVLILLGRAFWDSVRDMKHKWLLWVGALVLVGIVVLLTYLGINLPKEG